MAYVKLDTGILDSTLWIERECREIFITALLLALPYEATEPMPQYEVRSLTKTKFMVPPGWYGFVGAAGGGIVRRAMVEMEAGYAALEKLGSPDPESRSSAHEGRRLVRVDGGYIVLNYIQYRDRDHTAKERQQRFRDRKRHAVITQGNGVTSRNETVTSRIADADADADAVKKTLGPSPLARNALKAREEDFDGIWDMYPKRAGNNPRTDAWRAYKARIAEGLPGTHENIIAGLKRYILFLSATDKLDTEYVMRASTFLGKGKPYTQTFSTPKREGSQWWKDNVSIDAKAKQLNIDIGGLSTALAIEKIKRLM